MQLPPRGPTLLVTAGGKLSVRFYALEGSPRGGGRWRVRCLSSLRERPGGAALDHHMNAVDACALSRDAAGCWHLVAAGDSDEQVRLVDVDTTDNDAHPHTVDIVVLDHGRRPIRCVAIAPLGGGRCLVAAGNTGREVRLWTVFCGPWGDRAKRPRRRGAKGHSC